MGLLGLSLRSELERGRMDKVLEWVVAHKWVVIGVVAALILLGVFFGGEVNPVRHGV